MCFDADAHPPIEPIEGAATNHHRAALTARDGNRFAVYEAFADRGGSTGVVVLPDVRGLFPFYEELAIRLAEAGHDSIAIDYFGRTAGIGDRSESFDFQQHVPLVTREGLAADVAAAVDRLRHDQPDRSIFTLGFCFGGSSAWQQAGEGHGLAGAIGFYGRPDAVRPVGAKAPLDMTSEMAAPILALMGGSDPGIPPETVASFEAALSKSGVEYELVTYADAPHSFFDRKYDDYAEESADAWRRTLEFIRDHSK